MTIQDILQEKNMSVYRLAKTSQIPYATVNDICNGKTRLEKCSAETVYRLAHALNIAMEELLAPCFIKRSSFENFKSTVCHRVKELGDINFIIDTLESQDIRTYYNRENDVPICDDYDDLRRCKLEKPVYPASIRALSAAAQDDAAIKEASKTAIPEFMRFNIVENEVRNVI